MQLRPYQKEAIGRTLISLSNPESNPLVVLPTGSGKSVIIGGLVKELLTNSAKKDANSPYTNTKIMVLAHRKELLLQNTEAIQKMCPDVKVGIYSNSVGLKHLNTEVIVAGIASIARLKPEQLPPVSYLLIDEAHLVSNVDAGQYRKLIANLKEKRQVSVIGFSATPFRLKGGYLHKSEDRIFTEIAYELPITVLMEKGFLAPLTNKSSVVRVDLSDLHTRAGDFVQAEYDKKFNNNDLITQTVEDIMSYAHGRDSWLIFCSSVEHSHNVAAALQAQGISSAAIDGTTDQDERDRILRLFKEKKIKAITNCDVLTVGFDAPNVDLIALLRPTKSCGLYIQMVGRGTRLHKDKTNCLVLDYGQNIERFGPIDQIKMKQTFLKAEAETIPLKVCPDCREVISIKLRVCPECKYEYPVREVVREKHSSRASNLDILRTSLMRAKFDGTQVLDVYDHKFVIHTKPGKPPSVRIDYYLNMLDKVSEWICPGHTGYAKQKAIAWWSKHSDTELPKTAQEMINRRDELNLADKIIVAIEGNFPTIVKRFYKDTNKRLIAR